MQPTVCAPRRAVLQVALAAAAALVVLPVLASSNTLVVTSQFTYNVLGYDGANGTPLGVFASTPEINDPLDVIFGPDRNLYLSNGNADDILRFDGVTGAYLGVFASGGGLSGPMGMAFGHDGNLYVCSSNTNSILRYDGTTGAFIDTFVPSESGGISQPRGVAFGADGDLYVASYNNSSVMRFDGGTGAFIDVFVPSGSGGLRTPQSLVFGPDGNLYVPGGTIPSAEGVRRYNKTTGAFVDFFARLPEGYGCPADLVFGPEGNLYVVVQGCFGQGPDVVLRFNGKTGSFVNQFVNPGPQGPRFPFGLAFSPAPGAGVEESLPRRLSLGPVTPNPGHGRIQIGYSLPRDLDVRLEVFDLIGRRISVIVHGVRSLGTHRVSWDFRSASGEPAPAGVYIVKLFAGSEVATERIIRTR